MRYPKTKKEHSEHKKLLKMLSNHFSTDEHEIHEDEDEDNGRYGEEHSLEDQEMFDRNGFGDPMDTFVEEGDTRQNHENSYDDDDYESDDEDEDEEDDMDDEDMKPSKGDRKNLAVLMLGKKIGKGKAKKM